MRFKHIYSITIILIILVLLVNCAPREEDNLKVRNEISSANENFMTAFSQGDAAGVAALYTENGQVLPPNSEFVTGKEAIQAFWQTIIDMGIKEINLEIIEVDGHGNTAIEISKYTLRGDGEQVIDKGKYIVIWKKENGQWKLHRDIFNSSMPAQQKEEQ